MNWRAPNTGFYANAGGLGEINCQPQLVVRPQCIVARDDPFGAANLTFGTTRVDGAMMVIGPSDAEHLTDFRASFARNFSGLSVKVGFIQNLLSSTRTARYGRDTVWYKFWRDGTVVAGGLLDCRPANPPWFQGASAQLQAKPPGQAHSAPAMVECFDDVQWTIPKALQTEERATPLALYDVVLKHHFRLFAVAEINGAYTPICRIEWAMDIAWERDQGFVKTLVTKDASWAQPGPGDRLITGGMLAKSALNDQVATTSAP